MVSSSFWRSLKQHIKTRNIRILREFKIFRNRVNVLVKNRKRSFYKKKLLGANNKERWRIINDLMGKKKRKAILRK